MAPTAKAAKRAAVERLQHGDQIIRQHRLLLPGRRSVLIADAGHHRRDMAILAVQRLATLRVVPCERGKPAFDRRHRARLLVAGRRAGSLSRDVATVCTSGGNMSTPWRRPAGEMPLVGCIGPPPVGRTRRCNIGTGTAARASRCAGRRGAAAAGRRGEGASAGRSSWARPISMTTSTMSGRSSSLDAVVPGPPSAMLMPPRYPSSLAPQDRGRHRSCRCRPGRSGDAGLADLRQGPPSGSAEFRRLPVVRLGQASGRGVAVMHAAVSPVQSLGLHA